MMRQRGLTLVEVMIALAILAILIMAAAPYMTEWVVNNRIRSTAESIANGIRLAHSEAVRRNGPVTFTLTNGANSDWTVTDLAGGTIQSFVSDETASTAGTITVTRTPATIAAVRYSGLGRSVPTMPLTTTLLTRIDVDSTQLDVTRRRPLRIVMSAGGNIRMCDPSPKIAALTPPDPRAC